MSILLLKCQESLLKIQQKYYEIKKYLVSDYDFMTIDFSKASVSVLKVIIEPEEGLSCEPTFIITPHKGEGYAQSLKIAIKPLSSHEKVSECPADRAYNRLTVKGQFDMNLMNNWLFNILSDISVNIVEKVGQFD
jgi:hypothetical protein